MLLVIMHVMIANNISSTPSCTSILNDSINGSIRDGKILIIALDKTINETLNNTSMAILYKIRNLVEKLDSKTISVLINNIQSTSTEYKKHEKRLDDRITEAEYYSRKRVIRNQSLILKNISKNPIVYYVNATYSPKGDIIDPMLIVVNIISIVSFVIGLYVFRIIKKRTDYI